MLFPTFSVQQSSLFSETPTLPPATMSPVLALILTSVGFETYLRLVTNLAPMGCLPRITSVSSFKKCNETLNSLVKSQSLLLQQAVTKLNSETESSSFIILDLYASFTSVFKNKADHLGSIKFKKPLKPCCVGQSDSDWCGRRYDMDRSPMYTVSERNSAFFWDDAHPSQQG
ncbi:hypothetical protein ACLB2K_065830 [Fragaria x ananassa]